MNPLLTRLCDAYADFLEACMAEYRTTQDPERAVWCKIARSHVHIAQQYGDLDRTEDALANLAEAERIIHLLF